MTLLLTIERKMVGLIFYKSFKLLETILVWPALDVLVRSNMKITVTSLY